MKEPGKHIVIITGQQMVSNPRVWKEANTLVKNGYSVTVLTTIYDHLKIAADKELLDPQVNYKVSVNLSVEGAFNDRYIARIRQKVVQFIKKYVKKDSVHLIAYNPSVQVENALKEQADLYIAHQETGLIIGCLLLEKGKKVAFDIEDWYSRDYINSLRPVKLLEKYEEIAMKRGAYVTCPSNAMATALQETYSVHKKPSVIYNGFSVKENEQVNIPRQNDTLVWFSQVIGPGRGLETLMKALSFLQKPIEIHLAGKLMNDYEKDLQELLPKQHRLIFHAPMKHHELQFFLSGFNIGLAIENDYPESRDTTVTNKILQYIQAGNKVLATRTKGQSEIAAIAAESVFLVDFNHPVQWAEMILTILNQQDRFAEKQQLIFNQKLSWESQEPKLLSLVASATTSN